MNIKRIVTHLLITDWHAGKRFPTDVLNRIEQRISASESTHTGEIRFVVEAALEGTPLFSNQSAQARAIDVFSQLRIWDTENNNGLLIYLLLADHAVEIIADRGINAKVGRDAWQAICRTMENDFKRGDFSNGVVNGIDSVTKQLAQHFPMTAGDKNELVNTPLIM